MLDRLRACFDVVCLWLHSLGFGPIWLNWSEEKEIGVKVYDIAGNPEFEAVIMLIGVVHLSAELLVSQSRRIPFEAAIGWVNKSDKPKNG